MKWVHQMTWVAGLLGVGAGLFALYFYRVDYYQERGRRELLEEKLRAEQAVVENSAFLANMSHEIRTPERDSRLHGTVGAGGPHPQAIGVRPRYS
jgi:signal transduction histidine kinase